MAADIYDDRAFSELIEDYEKKNGSFDIVTYGAEWYNKIGAANILIEKGYFREISESEKKCFTDIPELCWDAGKVKGKHFTVPALNIGLREDTGMFFCFNTKYISEDKLQSFGCTVTELEDILNGITPNENLTGLEIQFDYLDFTHYTPASEKGGLYLSDKTMKAMNPYEAEEVIAYARALNSLYTKGYINYDISFSEWDSNKEYLKTEFAVSVTGGRRSEEDLKKRLGNDYQILEYSTPYYFENRLLYSTGIPVDSPHPKEAMELLKRLHGDKALSGLLTKLERNSIGLPKDNEPVETGKTKLSPFAGFELKYTEINAELRDTLISDFDRLCKTDDFDKTLEEINSELKAAGIDDYTAKVNKLLEENNALSNQ